MPFMAMSSYSEKSLSPMESAAHPVWRAEGKGP